MHELSLARNVVEIIRQNIPEDELANISLVRIRVGAVSGVVPESLAFCYQSLVSETALEHSVLQFERTAFRLRCNQCDATTENDTGLAVCGRCWSTDTTILSGHELEVREIELTEPAEKPL